MRNLLFALVVLLVPSTVVANWTTNEKSITTEGTGKGSGETYAAFTCPEGQLQMLVIFDERIYNTSFMAVRFDSDERLSVNSSGYGNTLIVDDQAIIKDLVSGMKKNNSMKVSASQRDGSTIAVNFNLSGFTSMFNNFKCPQ